MALHATCLASQVTSNHAPHRRLGSTLVVYRSGLQQHASHCYHAAFPSCWPVLASPSHFSRLVFPPLRTFLLLCQIFTLGHAQRLKSHARSVAARYFDRHRRALPPLVAGDRVLLKTAVLCRPLWLATACWSKLPCSAAPFSMLPYCAARPSPCRATLALLRWSSPLQATLSSLPCLRTFTALAGRQSTLTTSSWLPLTHLFTPRALSLSTSEDGQPLWAVECRVHCGRRHSGRSRPHLSLC